MLMSRSQIASSLVTAVAIALFASACAPAHHTKAATGGHVTPAKAVVTTDAPAKVEAVAAPVKPVKSLAVFQESGPNKGKCTPGIVATFAWHQAHDPALEGEIQAAIDALEAAKKSGQGVAEAGQNVRAVYDVKMPTLLSMKKNYPAFGACEVAGDSRIIGADQLSQKIATFRDFVKNEPAVPAGRVR